MPLFLALGVSTALALAQPRMYDSTARIWFFSSTDPALAGQPNTTPADAEVAVFRELLNSRAFDLKVGRRGPLATSLAETGLTSEQIDQRVYETLARKVLVAADGPQVVALYFQATSGTVAQGTIQALLDQFSEETLANRKNQAQAVVKFLEDQVKAQDATMTSATADVTKYTAAHPRAATTDVTLIGLQHAADLARQRYAELVVELGQARLDLASLDQAGGAGYRLIDPPTAPIRPVGLMGTLIRTSAGGILAGLLITAFALFGLTAADTSVRRAEDIRSALGLRVVGAIPESR
jgi:uncharacterized protein involved in exopolysaccharide biosynthesis